MAGHSDQVKFNIILLSDSRGRGLEARLNRADTNMRFHIEVHPGARLSYLMSRIGQLSVKSVGCKPMYDLAVIFGSICSITKITHMPYRAAILQKGTVEELLSQFKSECEYRTRPRNGIPVLLSPIVGIDLIQYAG